MSTIKFGVIAYRKGFITKEQLLTLAIAIEKSGGGI
jgi:hypothetical protein